MAVRVSLGAGRFRMVRQMLTQSLLLASIGGALGLVGARFGATILTRIMTSGTQSLGPSPRLEIPLDARVLTFTIGVTLLAALVFGLAPAIAAFVSAPASALRQGGGAQTKSRRVFGNGLVVAQVAISLALLSVSQLYIGHLRHLRDRSLGFDRDRVLLMSVNTSRAQNREQLAALYRDVVARLHAIPGVDSVAASGMTPISGAAGSAFLRVDDLTSPARRRRVLNTVSPNYFTYGTPLLAGRDFRDPTWISRAVSSSIRRSRGVLLWPRSDRASRLAREPRDPYDRRRRWRREASDVRLPPSHRLPVRPDVQRSSDSRCGRAAVRRPRGRRPPPRQRRFGANSVDE
jgi:hypothetical protein